MRVILAHHGAGSCRPQLRTTPDRVAITMRQRRSTCGLQRRQGSRPSRQLSHVVRAATGSKLRAWLEARRAGKPPLEARVLQGILDASEVPYSSFVAEPRTVLHSIDARIKEAWVIALLLLVARASGRTGIAIASGVALLTVATQTRRLWRAQLPRLIALAAFLFLATAIGSDGVPPVTQPRIASAAQEGLPAFAPDPTQARYRYVLFDIWFLTVTRRSVALGSKAAALTFTALQSAALVLTSTPAEALAVAIRSLLAPLRLLRAPVSEIGLTLLLSLRFMAVAFEEIRNLALGVAAHGLQWPTLGPAGGIRVLLSLFQRLFGRLLEQSETIAAAMAARGFAGPEDHKLYLTQPEPSSAFTNVAALTALAAVTGVVMRYG